MKQMSRTPYGVRSMDILRQDQVSNVYMCEPGADPEARLRPDAAVPAAPRARARPAERSLRRRPITYMYYCT